jgi:hypothetical protein
MEQTLQFKALNILTLVYSIPNFPLWMENKFPPDVL